MNNRTGFIGKFTYLFGAKEATMIRKLRTFALTALSVVAYCQLAFGQAAQSTVLEIELENYVVYYNDVTDMSKMASDPSRTTITPPRNFANAVGIADIVSVNGKPAKGVMTERRTQLNHAINPNPGQAIADTVRQNWHERHYEILKPDGTPIGSIMTTGPGGGNPIPGAPSGMLGADFMVVGGTGAFMGARGQAGGTRDTRPEARNASMMEDPANRRMHGGGQRRFVIQMIPMSRPEIVQTPSGHAVTHSSDFTVITPGKPARPGEILSVFATGLGPTSPGVDPGKPFPANPLVRVNSPVEVTVNGAPAEVLDAVGFPGAVDGYQVNFRLPSGIAPGQASIQVSAAWIASSEAKISVSSQ